MDSILSLKGVVKQFEGLTAVDHLSMEVERGSIHSLVGPNGSGKSTTINMINGMLPLTEGEIYFNGVLISGKKTHQIANMGIGRTFQNIKVFNSLTVLENIMVGGHAIKKRPGGLVRYLVDVKGSKTEEKMLREKATEIGEFLGMKELLNQYVNNLPYGLQKMTELGRTLMSEPELLLLDEPAAGLNPSERANLVDMMWKIKETGKTMLLIEHNMDIVMNVSNIITVINFGSKIAEGTAEEVQNDPAVIEAYLGNRYNEKQSGGESTC